MYASYGLFAPFALPNRYRVKQIPLAGLATTASLRPDHGLLTGYRRHCPMRGVCPSPRARLHGGTGCVPAQGEPQQAPVCFWPADRPSGLAREGQCAMRAASPCRLIGVGHWHRLSQGAFGAGRELGDVAGSCEPGARPGAGRDGLRVSRLNPRARPPEGVEGWSVGGSCAWREG